MPPALYALTIFRAGCHVYAWAGLDIDPPIYASLVAGMTGAHHHAQSFFFFKLVEMVSLRTFCLGWPQL
jgi:hypothetical protein